MSGTDSESTARAGIRTFIRENSLSLFFSSIFLAALAGQAIAGHNLYNQEQLAARRARRSASGATSPRSDFGQAVMENWQSEYLQFALFALATVWLVQKGSPESKELDKAGTESDKEQKVGGHADADSPALGRGRRSGGRRSTRTA